MTAGRCLRKACFVPGPLYLLSLLPGMFPQMVSGLLGHSHLSRQPPCFSCREHFTANRAHSVRVHCVSLYVVQSIVCFLDLQVYPRHLGQGLPPPPTSAEGVSEGGLCLILRHETCHLLTQLLHGIVHRTVGSPQPLCKNNR